ncbi:MAG TPA: hypothetical protein VHA52_10225, partial [Candidatus Babeliaceae bacterium]|nr:hypothetical protein [Candidatus Babeliaceae bacterium]
MVDCIVNRHELKDKLSSLLSFLLGNQRNFALDRLDAKAIGKLPQKLKELLALSEQELVSQAIP